MTEALAPRLRAVLETMNSAGWTRNDAHALLDAALDLADGASDGEGEAGRLAQAAALTLSRSISGWMVPAERAPEEWDNLAATDTSAWREAVIERMRLTPTSIPRPVVDMLMFAFMDLQRGELPSIFRRKGASLKQQPKKTSLARLISRHHLEQTMLVWAEIEIARNRQAVQVRGEVATAVGKSIKTIESWSTEWIAREGKDRREAVFNAARALARGEKISSPFPDELWLLSFKTPRAMHLLSDDFPQTLEALRLMQGAVALATARGKKIPLVELPNSGPLKSWITLLALADSWTAEKV